MLVDLKILMGLFHTV